MPPDRSGADDPQAWLRRARSNLARARDIRLTSEILLEDLCFDAQQAAEKAIKAVLIARNIEFPRTHSIADLLTLLQQSGTVVPDQIREAIRLTRYAVQTRYPGVSEEVTPPEHQAAVALAENVVRFAEQLINIT